MDEFTRFKILVDDNYSKIENLSVLILGVGGVGSYAAESLARIGIKNITLVDYDIVDITNINRQIMALHSTIGKKKIDVLKERILDINPNCNVIIYNMFLNKDNFNILDNHHIDYIIDCCDSVDAKKLLIDYSLSNNIKLISSMGTANKMNPMKLEIIDIRKTSYDPLAKKLRKYVLDLKTNKKVMVVSSTEKPVKSKQLSTLIFVPATAGLLCSSYVINDIIKSE